MTLKSHAWAAELYGVLTVLMTWPLAARLTLMEAGDSSYFAWAMAWTTKALLHDPLSLPHANTLFPARYTLFLDEPIVGTSVLALPLGLFTSDPIITLNVVRLLTFFLTALGMRALGLSLGLSPLAAIAAGAIFSFSSNRVSSPAHLSVLGTQFLPLYFLFLHRWARTGSGKAAVLAGLFFGLSAWACGYQALLAAAILPIPILLLIEKPAFLRTAPLGIVVALAFLLPLQYLHKSALAPLGYERTASETAFFSAPLEGFFATSAENRVWGGATENLRTVVEANMFQGFAVLILAALAVIALRHQTGSASRRAVIGYAVLAVCAALVAVGPEIRLFGTTLLPGPFALLRDLEIFRMIRVPARASVFVALGLSMLAAFGLDALKRPAVRVAMVVIALVEAWAAPLNVVAADRCIASSEPVPAIYAWLKAQPDEPVIELPILPNDGLFQRPRFDDSVYLLRSTVHWKRLVNGYAGTEPPLYRDLREEMKDFPSDASIARLRALGVRFVLVHLRALGPNRRTVVEERLQGSSAGLRERARFDDDLALEIIPRESTALPPSPPSR